MDIVKYSKMDDAFVDDLFADDVHPLTILSVIIHLETLIPTVEQPSDIRKVRALYRYDAIMGFINALNTILPRLAERCNTELIEQKLRYRISGSLMALKEKLELIEGLMETNPDRPEYISRESENILERRITFITYSFLPLIEADAAEAIVIILADEKASQKPPKLNGLETQIIIALGKDRLVGPDIGVKIGRDIDSVFKATLASLVRREILGNRSGGSMDNRGYAIEEEYLYLLKKLEKKDKQSQD